MNVPAADPALLLREATQHTRRGELEAGWRLASDALARFHARGDRDGRMRTINLLGAIAWERGAVQDAERRFGEALAIAEELGDPTLGARTSNNLASVANLRGHPLRALSLYRQALLNYQRLGDRRGLAETWHNLSLTWREMERPDEAESAAHEALRHAERTGDHALLALVMTGRAELELLRDDLRVAERTLAQARRLAAEAEDALGQAEAERVQALLYLRDRKPELALRAALGARSVADVHGSALLAAECSAVAAVAARTLRHADAETHAAMARAGFEVLHAVRLAERFEKEWNRR